MYRTRNPESLGDTYSGNHIIPGSFDYEGTCAEVLAMKTMIKDQVNENGGITVSCISRNHPCPAPVSWIRRSSALKNWTAQIR